MTGRLLGRICESGERLTRLLPLLAVRRLVWKGARCVASNIVELAAGRAGRGDRNRGGFWSWDGVRSGSIHDGLEERLMNPLQQLRLNFARIFWIQLLKDGADFVPSTIVHVGCLPPAQRIDDPSGSRSIVNFSTLLLNEDNGVRGLQVL